MLMSTSTNERFIMPLRRRGRTRGLPGSRSDLDVMHGGRSFRLIQSISIGCRGCGIPRWIRLSPAVEVGITTTHVGCHRRHCAAMYIYKCRDGATPLRPWSPWLDRVFPSFLPGVSVGWNMGLSTGYSAQGTGTYARQGLLDAES